MLLQGDERLLKLYETGLPIWAIYMPAWGCPYRPWMRTITWLLFIAISIFSLACGFYDLYKNVPYLDQVRGKPARLQTWCCSPVASCPIWPLESGLFV